MMARNRNVPFKGRIQKRKTYPPPDHHFRLATRGRSIRPLTNASTWSAVKWRRLSQFWLNECPIPGRTGLLDRRDIGRASLTPAEICVARGNAHCFREELDPVPHANIVRAIKRHKFAVAGMENRADGVATLRKRGRPCRVRLLRQRSRYWRKGAAHMAGAGRSIDEIQTRNPAQQVNDLLVDWDMRGEPDMPVQQDAPLHWNGEQRSKSVGGRAREVP